MGQIAGTGLQFSRTVDSGKKKGKRGQVFTRQEKEQDGKWDGVHEPRNLTLNRPLMPRSSVTYSTST